jgi:predicted RND superfamily exporter protein|tara:strand:+ start:1035 stop:3341 length:2307 start_codon:yes stop_codon:yes gene_type:complete
MNIKKSFTETFAKKIIQYRHLSILFCLTLLIVSFRGLDGVSFSPAMEQFFPENHPVVNAHIDIEETFYSSDGVIIAIGVDEGNVFNPRILNLIEEITNKAWTTPHSMRVDSLSNFSYVRAEKDDLIVEPFIENSFEWDREKISLRSALIEKEEQAYGTILSKDKKTTYINISIDSPGNNIEKEYMQSMEHILDFMKPLKEDYPEADIRYAGIVYMEYLSPLILKAEMPILVPTLLFVILLSLFILLRNLTAVASSLIVIIFSVITSLGILGHFNTTVSQPIIMVPILVATLAVADCVHLFNVYFQNKLKSNTKDSITKSLELNLEPLLLTSLTTSIGFLCLNLAPIPALRVIANGIAIGVVAAFIFSIFFLAPLLSFFNVKASSQIENQTKLSRRVGQFSLNHRKKIIWLVPIFSAILMSFIPLNETKDNPSEFYTDRHTSAAEDTIWLANRLGGTFIVTYEYTSEDGITDPEYLGQLNNFTTWLENQDEVLSVSSLSKTIKNLNRTLNEDNQSAYVIPDDSELIAQYLFFYEMSLPFGLDLTSTINQERTSTKVAVSLKEIDSKAYSDFDDKVENYANNSIASGSLSEGGGTRSVLSFMGMILAEQLMYALIIGLVMITLAIALFYRSFSTGLITAIPNILPIGVAFGIWGIVNSNVSMLVSLGIGCTLGIVVDFSVHFLSKYLYARKQLFLSAEDSILYAFETVGFPLTIMTISLVLGFSVLYLASFMPLHGFAGITMIAFLAALIIDLLLFPAILIAWDGKKKYN